MSEPSGACTAVDVALILRPDLGLLTDLDLLIAGVPVEWRRVHRRWSP